MLGDRNRRTPSRGAAAVRLVAVGVSRRRDRTAVHRQVASAHFDARVAADDRADVHRHVRVAVQGDAHVRRRVRIGPVGRRRGNRAVHLDVDLVLRVLEVAEDEQDAVHRAVNRHVNHVLLVVVRAEHVEAVDRTRERDVLADRERALRREAASAAHLDRRKAGIRSLDRALAGDRQAAARKRDVARARDVESVEVERNRLVLARRRIAVARASVGRRRASVHEEALRERDVRKQRHRVARLGGGDGRCEGGVIAIDGIASGNRSYIIAGLHRLRSASDSHEVVGRGARLVDPHKVGRVGRNASDVDRAGRRDGGLMGRADEHRSLPVLCRERRAIDGERGRRRCAAPTGDERVVNLDAAAGRSVDREILDGDRRGRGVDPDGIDIHRLCNRDRVERSVIEERERRVGGDIVQLDRAVERDVVVRVLEVVIHPTGLSSGELASERDIVQNERRVVRGIELRPRSVADDIESLAVAVDRDLRRIRTAKDIAGL